MDMASLIWVVSIKIMFLKSHGEEDWFQDFKERSRVIGNPIRCFNQRNFMETEFGPHQQPVIYVWALTCGFSTRWALTYSNIMGGTVPLNFGGSVAEAEGLLSRLLVKRSLTIPCETSKYNVKHIPKIGTQLRYSQHFFSLTLLRPVPLTDRWPHMQGELQKQYMRGFSDEVGHLGVSWTVGYPQHGGFQRENAIYKWMIWGYHHLWNLPSSRT